MKYFIRRAKDVAATIIDTAVAPFGYQINVLVDTSLPGISSFSIMRAPAGCPRTRRITPRS